MSKLASIKSQLLKTQEMIAQGEQSLLAYPHRERSIVMNIQSLEKVKRQLEAQFKYEAERSGYDFCNYRLISDNDRYPITSVMPAVLAFQTFVTTVYDALVRGAKRRFRQGGESSKESAFECGLVYQGSVGFMMAAVNERLLGITSSLDDAIDIVSQMTTASTPEMIGRYATKYGIASVRAMRQWVEAHVDRGLSAEMKWERGGDIRSYFLMQRQELAMLREVIDNTSEFEEHQWKNTGTIVKIDSLHRRFTFVPDGDENGIEGYYTDNVQDAEGILVPSRYEATIIKRIRIRFAYEDDEIEYFLDGLREIE